MKKKIIIVVSIMLVLTVGVAVGITFNSKQTNQVNNKNEIKENVNKLPAISVMYDSEVVGKIDGYTTEMNESHMRDVIIPVAPSHNVPMKIFKNDNEIKSIEYKVTDLKEDSLVDSGKIEKWTNKKKYIELNYSASAIMEIGTEYSLSIIISTDKHDKIYYYTRAMVTDDDVVMDQIKFAKKFSDDTFDEESGTKLAAYLEPDSSYASDSLGLVTIKSTLGMLIWKTLVPEKTVKTEVSVKDFCVKDTGESGTYTLLYEIKATNAEKKEERYNVAETITVWTYQGQNYVLAYNREVNQIWECNDNNVGNAFIDLGIQKQNTEDYVESDNQQYISYEINGDAYVMDVLDKKIVPIFKYDALDSEDLYKTGVKILSVEDNGDVKYMIYGRSPGDIRIGENGISIMNYSYKDNSSKEVLFIPSSEPMQILKEQMADLCYEGDGTVYIMISNTIYFANLKTKEWGTLAENLQQGSCVVKTSGSMIAYNTDGSLYNSDSITIVDLSNGEKQELTEDGKKVAVCGFNGDNLVYGVADIKSNESYGRFPMKTLKIVDKNLKEIKTYYKKGVILSDVEVTDSVINFKQWRKNKQLDEEQILNTTEEKQSVVNSSYYMDDVKMQELALAFSNNLDSNIDLTIGELGETYFESKTNIDAQFLRENTKKFYVYSYGRLQGIYSNKTTAIKQAKENFGHVINENGAKIWVFEENYK